jgi:probable F420-dependent oxidoreductase
MHRPFRFGVVTGGSAQSHTAWVTLARRVEELGYATLLMPDRPSFGGLAPLTALAVAAQATTSLRVGSYVFCNDYRHPALLAREVSTLDLLSEGRFELGLGAGAGPSDYRQMGLPFESAATRVSRLEEALHIIKQLFTEEIVNFSGKHYTITEMKGLPRPVQKPHPPIFIGSAGKRMLSIGAREADSIAPTLRMSTQGVDPSDATLAQKIAWVREAAAERFTHLELAQTAYYITITDSRTGVAPQPGGPPIPKIPMSIEQAVAHLLEQRERYGFSYIQVMDAQIENFAPLVARLAGQ